MKKKEYMMPSIKKAEACFESILAGSVMDPNDPSTNPGDNGTYDGEFDANRNGSFWDDED